MNAEILSREEWELILELLEREEADLRCEIRHARFYDVKQVLKEKREMIDRLIERIRDLLGEAVSATS